MLAEEGRWRGGQWLQPSRGRIWAQLFASLYFPASFKQDNSTLQNPLEKMHDSLESSVSLATELQRESFILTCIYAQLRSSVVSVHPSIPLTRVEKNLTTERYFKENPFWVGLEQRTGKASTRERKYDWKSLFWEAGEEQYRPWQWVRVPGGTASWEAAASAGSIQKTCLHCKMQGSPQSFIVLLASSCSLLTHCVSRAEHRSIPKRLYCQGATAAGRGVPSPWHRSELQEEEEGVSEAQNGAASDTLHLPASPRARGVGEVRPGSHQWALPISQTTGQAFLMQEDGRVSELLWGSADSLFPLQLPSGIWAGRMPSGI